MTCAASIQWRSRATAYGHTCMLSLYIHPWWRKRGGQQNEIYVVYGVVTGEGDRRYMVGRYQLQVKIKWQLPKDLKEVWKQVLQLPVERKSKYSNSVELLVLKDQQKAACARESSGATEKEWGMRLCRSLQSVFCLEWEVKVLHSLGQEWRHLIYTLTLVIVLATVWRGQG